MLGQTICSMDAAGKTLCWSTSEGGMETLDIHGFGPLGRFSPNEFN